MNQPKTTRRDSGASFPGRLTDKLGSILFSFFTKIYGLMKPDPVVWRGAAMGLAGLVLILLILMVVLVVRSTGVLVGISLVLFFTVASLLAATGIFYGLKWINHIPSLYRFVLFASLIALVNFWEGNTEARLFLVICTLFLGTLLGGVMSVLLLRPWSAIATGKKVLNLAIAILGMGGLAFGFIWLFMEGKDTGPPDNAALMSEYRPDHISLPDPSLEGDYPVLEMTYGSGRDKRRKDFREKVAIQTNTVDGSRYVSNWDKLHGWLRTKYWGFDEKSLPLNGRVWWPDGRDPFPLVLIVHGNHADRDFSDPGYAYLGRLMASRGFIFVSVDQNFLNGAWYDLFDGLKEENDCRAWLLLKHLECWRSWNQDRDNPFYQMVDMNNIGLIGHSRGGEAVAIAACFNRLPHNPDDATLTFDFNFNIRSVIAIAPVDGQYKPAGAGTKVENTNYFVIHGSNDMDLRTYDGSRQYQRIKFEGNEYHVKAGLFVFGANHGQFNTRWGRNDNSFPYMALFSKKQIMPRQDQEKIAKVFFSAFLEATLKGKTAYLDLFRDFRCGMEWLPATVYLNQYEDPACELICTFEEDINVLTTTVKGGSISAENLTFWKERVVPLKWNNQATRAVYAGWNLEETDSLPGKICIRQSMQERISTDEQSYLYFVMADAKEDSNPNPRDDKTEDTTAVSNEKEPAEAPIDLTLVLSDSAGQVSALPLSAYSYLSRQLEPKLMKADFMTDVAPSDLVFQVFFYSLSAFREQNPGLDIGCIEEIRFVFDRARKGVVVIDNIGFWKDHRNAAP
jgi:hypothetical protein